jgi:hypothetical protein
MSESAYDPMIRQDHLVGRTRNVISISICSIGTIRGGISTGAPGHESFRWNEGVVTWLWCLPMKRSSGTKLGVITAPSPTHETFLRNVIGVFTASMPTHETYLRNAGDVLMIRFYLRELPVERF